jgi:hypothetical protein
MTVIPASSLSRSELHMLGNNVPATVRRDHCECAAHRLVAVREERQECQECQDDCLIHVKCGCNHRGLRHAV